MGMRVCRRLSGMGMFEMSAWLSYFQLEFLWHKRCHQHATSTFAYQLLSHSVATDLLSLLLAMASRATSTRYLSKACCKKGLGFRVWVLRFTSARDPGFTREI